VKEINDADKKIATVPAKWNEYATTRQKPKMIIMVIRKATLVFT
jgi:hypothetical protein